MRAEFLSEVLPLAVDALALLVHEERRVGAELVAVGLTVRHPRAQRSRNVGTERQRSSVVSFVFVELDRAEVEIADPEVDRAGLAGTVADAIEEAVEDAPRERDGGRPEELPILARVDPSLRLVGPDLREETPGERVRRAEAQRVHRHPQHAVKHLGDVTPRGRRAAHRKGAHDSLRVLEIERGDRDPAGDRIDVGLEP
ncbi:MAG: hypothetical protein ABJE95_00705 [Byssovorax sp.]